MQSSPPSFMDVSPSRIYACPIFDFWVVRIVLNMGRMAFFLNHKVWFHTANELCENKGCVYVCIYVYV